MVQNNRERSAVQVWAEFTHSPYKEEALPFYYEIISLS